MGILSTLDLLVSRGSSVRPRYVAVPAFVPGGRLSLTGNPIHPVDATAAPILYYVPYVHDWVQLWDAKQNQWIAIQFPWPTGLPQLALTGLLGNRTFDIFGALVNGRLALEFGLQWPTDTTRAVDVNYTDGRLTKVGDKSRLLLGTVTLSGDGIAEDSGGAIGVAPKRYLSNVYNRVPRHMFVGEPTDNWVYSGVGRQANANATNQLNFTQATNDLPVEAEVLGLVSTDGSLPNRNMFVGIGLDTVANIAESFGFQPYVTNQIQQVRATWRGYGGVGRHFLAWTERTSGTTGTTWYGDNGTPSFYQAGIRGIVWN